MTNAKDKRRLRKVAAHRVVVGEEAIAMAVVDIADGCVVGWRKLEGEEAYTEWLGGDIRITCEADGTLRAYHGGIPLK